MADLFNIMKIHVGEDKLRARVLVNPGMPVRTSEDIEATARVARDATGAERLRRLLTRDPSPGPASATRCATAGCGAQ